MPYLRYYVFGINAILLRKTMPIEQKDIDEARDILGDIAKDISDDDLRNMLVEIQFLVESWIDEYERKNFNGKTLNELLGSL
jgi:hypothetical protein